MYLIASVLPSVCLSIRAVTSLKYLCVSVNLAAFADNLVDAVDPLLIDGVIRKGKMR